jgi:hypothetical protein
VKAGLFCSTLGGEKARSTHGRGHAAEVRELERAIADDHSRRDQTTADVRAALGLAPFVSRLRRVEAGPAARDPTARLPFAAGFDRPSQGLRAHVFLRSPRRAVSRLRPGEHRGVKVRKRVRSLKVTAEL